MKVATVKMTSSQVLDKHLVYTMSGKAHRIRIGLLMVAAGLRYILTGPRHSD